MEMRVPECAARRRPSGKGLRRLDSTMTNRPTTLRILSHSNGFTLIELMMVVAIIGILAAIAIPAYQNYTIRAQVTEGMTLADGWKTAIAEYYANTGNMPAAIVNLAGTCQSVGKYESSILV